MPLTTNEKNLLISVFRMSLAVSEKRNDDAVNAYADILNEVTGAASSSDCDDMPPLVPLAFPSFNTVPSNTVPFNTAPSKPIDLVISELPSAIISDSFSSQQKHQGYAMGNFVRAPPAFCGVPTARCDTPDATCNVSAIDNDGEDAVVEEYAGSLSDDSEEAEEAEEAEEVDDDADVDCCNGHIDADADADEEADEKVEETDEEAEEEVELELEPVRIKKVIYWKDSNSGDIYACLPDDEVGDKVGQYVDGKPVFD